MRSNARSREVGVIFDGDDTLWMTEPLYDEAREAVREIVADAGHDGDKWEALERELDVRNVALWGHRTERFPSSCVQAYAAVCAMDGTAFDRSVARRVRHEARSVFVRDANVLPPSKDVVETLRGMGIPTALLTKGDPAVQIRRIRHSKLSGSFASIHIVPAKSPQVINATLARLGTSARSSWLVGNSVPSDVMPALLVGMNAVWIDAPVWEFERCASLPQDPRARRVEAIDAIPDLVFA